MDTIFAPATARGRAGVAVVRISGPEALKAAEALCGRLPPERQAGLRRLRWQGEVLDEALVLVFPVGRSFTGEAVVELHLHGSIAVVGAVLAALARMPGLRLAEPGEFTRRALENGRLDLTQVEGLGDLLSAETEAQRRQAQRVLSGEIGRRAESWRAALIRAAALLEATIDFADEDVPEDVLPEVRALLTEVQTALRREVAGATVAERLRDGFEVVILGRPNVGKSTLLNALAGREAALTSAVAGTTRDVIEVRMDLAGLPVTFLDTAGLRETEDAVEQLGVARARERAVRADLRLWLVEPGEVAETAGPDDLVVVGKADLWPEATGAVSGTTGAGVAELMARIEALLSDRVAAVGAVTHVRQAAALKRAIAALESGTAALDAGAPVELVAEELRQALRGLDALVGRVDVEHILDVVFASFCIGK